jgi:copper/silver efflux system protein
MEFPEVASVFAKAGGAGSATDPAPLEMVETVINLKPPEQWRKGETPEKLIAEFDRALGTKLTGFSNSWTMPIKARIDMLSTGIRTPVGGSKFSVRTSTRLGVSCLRLKSVFGMCPARAARLPNV